MTSTTMNRLGLLDAAFWYLEDANAALHIASVTVFEGPAPSYGDLREAVERKLPDLPRYRTKLRTIPFGLARPVWIDDVEFDLDFHLRRAALPAPGGDDQLRIFIQRLMSQRLDVDHPLWEAWLVEGMADGQWAMVWKVHHSMVDGVGGMALLATMLDATPDPPLPAARAWAPHPEPGGVRLIGSVFEDRVHGAIAGARAVTSSLRRPVASLRIVAATAHGLARYATALRPVSKSSLVGTLDSSRGYAWTSVAISDVAAVRRSFGGSLNDVVLAMVTRGFRDRFICRHEWPGPHAVRCLVPVSIRASADAAASDNRISALLADLPVHVEDPLDRYRAVVAHTTALKSSHEAAAGKQIIEFANHLPSRVTATALRAGFRAPQRFINTVVTNVPGPRMPLYLLGRRMVAVYPYVPIADRLRVGVAVTSYDGRLYFGITSDHDSTPDADILNAGILDGLDELVRLAVGEGDREGGLAGTARDIDGPVVSLDDRGDDRQAQATSVRT